MNLQHYIQKVKARYPNAYCYHHPSKIFIIYSDLDLSSCRCLSLDPDSFQGNTAPTITQAWKQACSLIYAQG